MPDPYRTNSDAPNTARDEAELCAKKSRDSKNCVVANSWAQGSIAFGLIAIVDAITELSQTLKEKNQ